MIEQLNQTMEAASRSLVKMDYLACERGCLEALAAARSIGAWDYYARILLPLQECRRQRRMMAAEGMIMLGTGHLSEDAFAHLPAELRVGCVAISRPGDVNDALHWQQQARDEQRYVEVIYISETPDQGRWTLRSFDGPTVVCAVDPPPEAWRHRWWSPGEVEAAGDSGGDVAGGEATGRDAAEAGAEADRRWRPQAVRTPADWFIDATEALGDAALAQVSADLPACERVLRLEERLAVVTDHELLHQHLFAAAQALSQQQAGV